MAYSLFYISTGLFFLSLSLSLFSPLGPLAPEPLLPLILFLALFSPVRRGLAISIILGAISDILGGSIFGIGIVTFAAAFIVGDFFRDQFHLAGAFYRTGYILAISALALLVRLALLFFVAGSTQSSLLVISSTPKFLINNLLIGAIYLTVFPPIDDFFGWLPSETFDLNEINSGGLFGGGIRK